MAEDNKEFDSKFEGYTKKISKLQKIKRVRKFYFLYCPHTNRVKIGRTDINVKKRTDGIKSQASNGAEYRLLFSLENFNLKGESDLHRIFKEMRVHGEWFEVRGDLQEFIERVCDNQISEESKHNVVIYEQCWKTN